jgi:ABC-type transport system involved in cytochrome bd biosynthesis fused ATPase/permease subunit
VAFVPQNPKLLNRTVYDNLSYGLPSVSREQAQEALHNVGLNNVALDKRVGKQGARLSTGQRASLYLAKALLQDAKVLIVDEITANLDPVATAEVLRALDLAAQDRTLIFISHSTTVADQFPFTRHIEVSAGEIITN